MRGVKETNGDEHKIYGMRLRLLCSGVATGLSLDVATASEKAAVKIRQQALLPPNGPKGRPLPLVSHWNMGSQGRGWTPHYQLELLAKGHHILPWLSWPRGNPDASEKNAERFNDYYGAMLAYCREHKLPICFRGTQWEAILVKRQYRELSPQKCPAVITPEGKAITKLSPFGPIDPWRDAGDIPQRRWIRWSIALASLPVNPQNITKLSIGIDGKDATGTLYFDDIRLYRPPQP